MISRVLFISRGGRRIGRNSLDTDASVTEETSPGSKYIPPIGPESLGGRSLGGGDPSLGGEFLGGENSSLGGENPVI